VVEKILVKGQLTTDMIEAGRRLLARLRESNHEVAAAYWLYNSDAGEWRLTLAMPEVDADGPREVYARIWNLLPGSGDSFIGLDLSNITVISPQDQLVRTLRGLSRGRVHLTRACLGFNWVVHTLKICTCTSSPGATRRPTATLCPSSADLTWHEGG
jgi:hypothetical protein